MQPQDHPRTLGSGYSTQAHLRIGNEQARKAESLQIKPDFRMPGNSCMACISRTRIMMEPSIPSKGICAPIRKIFPICSFGECLSLKGDEAQAGKAFEK
jgi:hypothetical protein